MPYEDDYKMWLEKSLIEMNPDWVCDGMTDKEFTHKWCEENCGKDNAYIMPKCLHMYYHHIVMTDRKTENSSEIPNNCEDGPTHNQHVQRVEYVGNDEKSRCWTCKHFERMHETPISSDGSYYTYVVCTASECHYEPKDEPQTETEMAKAIVHKMIDDAVIAEDAYPDLRQKMHDAVDEYEPQTDCAWR